MTRADMWSPATNTEIFLPKDARYAVGVHCVNSPADAITYDFTIEVDFTNGVQQRPICSGTSVNRDDATVVIYCEVALQKQVDNRLIAYLTTGDAVYLTMCRMNVREIGSANGTVFEPLSFVM